MGNEIATVGGAIGTAATGIAASVCFGQVETLNGAVKDCAKYTGEQFMESSVRHAG